MVRLGRFKLADLGVRNPLLYPLSYRRVVLRKRGIRALTPQAGTCPRSYLGELDEGDFAP